MDKVIRCITSDGAFMAIGIDASDLVYTAQNLHNLNKTTAAAFGRLLSASSMMGTLLKNDKASLTVKIDGGGPIGTMLVKADSHGNVRGFVDHPEVDFPIRESDGKIDVGAAVGKNGRLAVLRDQGSGEPYVGQVELVSGEIGEDITAYYAYSEQVPSVCAVGVLTDKEDDKVILAGGLLIQVLPGAYDSEIQKLEENIAKLEPVTTMLAKGFDAFAMCKAALEGFEVEKLDEFAVNYVCNCSKEKFSEMLLTIGSDDIRDLPLVADGRAEAICEYCNKKYHFTKEELEALALEAEERVLKKK
ncbi:Hsp33 family molecular chaperone HslO [Scatolibacter rhodanostii]|uniref:Hsp33 family molecular chaperone HslO n=1 Tax=Scatolibacter rhodanostii TaxID=2014781 RepID=UPI000C07873B|nr:Hsp33 family molecular chaperone HslO [Scatolibacter rhodanostii]